MWPEAEANRLISAEGSASTKYTEHGPNKADATTSTSGATSRQWVTNRPSG